MSEIDPLVAEILLKGDDEFIGKIKKVGEEAAENWEKLSKAFEDGASSIQLAAKSLSLLEVAIAGVTAATIAFIEKQTELSQATKLLANSFGTSGAQLQEIEQIFAASGVKVEQFERFAVRLSTTIAREYPHIAESIRNFATESEASHVRVIASTLRVEEAQKNLVDHQDERAAQSVRDNLSIEQAYIKLQFAAQHAANEQVASLQAVRGAQLSVEAAEQRLAELEGRPPSAAQKQTLAIAQAQQAVDQARRSEAEARLAQQEKAASAALKQAQIEQEYDDIRRKAAKNARDDADQRLKDELAVKEAIIARAEAEEKAAKFALTNIGSIKAALDAIVAGNKAAATAINLTEVTVENLKRAIIAQAAETSKAATPTGFEALRAVAKLLAADIEKLITPQQRLRLVTELAGTSMHALGVSAAEILNVIEHDAKAFDELANNVEKNSGKIDQNAHKIEEFRGALAKFNLVISQLSQAFAAAISPVFTAFLEALTHSLQDSTGVLHNFIAGISAIGSAIASILGSLGSAINLFARLVSFGTTGGLDLLKVALIGIGTAITVATGPIGVMVVAIGAVITAIGSIRDNWDTIVLHVRAAWDAIKDNAVIKFLTDVLGVVTNIVKAIVSAAAALDKLTALGGSGAGKSAAASGGSGEAVEGHADGGLIRGPGSGTSDSILSRLSNGEFVVKAKAVQAYGASLFHALNNMQLPGFADGGLVAAPVRLGGAGGGAIQGARALNLTIDGRTFNGFKGPANVVESLANFAVSRQTSSAGRQPSWVK